MRGVTLGQKKCNVCLKLDPKAFDHYGCQTGGKTAAVRLSALKYKEQDWMINLPLYAVCNL